MPKDGFDPRYYSKEETQRKAYRCEDCKYENTVGVLPTSPVIAKHICVQCGRENRVKTRDSFEDVFADHFGEAAEIRDFQRRAPSSSKLLKKEYDAIREARERARGPGVTVRTVYGNARLIG